MKTKETIKIVIVEDNLYHNKALIKYINTLFNSNTYPKLNFEIKSYLTAHDCIEELDDNTDIMVLDYYLINKDESDVLTGLDVVRAVNKNCSDCKVLVASTQQNSFVTSELMKLGVYDYIDTTVNTKNRIGSVLQHLINTEYLVDA
jgi:response regulator of citrate/malate metabolism